MSLPDPSDATATLSAAAIIVSYNRKADLRRCLASLDRLQPRLAEIIVVDNGSTDGTAAMVGAEFPTVKFCAARANLGPCLARNAAALLTTEPLLWFLDSDTEAVSPQIAAELAAVLDDQTIAAVGGEAVLGKASDGSIRVVGVKALRLTRNALVRGDVASAPGVVPCGAIASCNLMVRRSDFLRIGGFDPFYFFFYEDIDLTWRLVGGGRGLTSLSPMGLVHHYSDSARVKRLWLEGRNRLYFVVKTRGLWGALRLPLDDALSLVNPENMSRLIKRSAKGDTAREQFVTDAANPSTAERGLAARTLRMLRLGAMRFAMMAFGYPAILPHLGKAIRAHRQPMNHLADPAALLALIDGAPRPAAGAVDAAPERA